MTSNNTNGVAYTHHQNGDVVLQGYHKKLKTMKRKYFVLLADDDKNPARLEYYDSEKKFKSSKSTAKPKRSIHLKNCFNINRRLDTKHDYVIALSTREEVFCMVLDDEREMNKWLKLLLILQRGENIENTSAEDTPQPNYEHVWQVQIQKRGLAEKHGMVGPYYVCLTTKCLTLIRIQTTNNINSNDDKDKVEFPLATIRRYGDSAILFYLEVGRKSRLGTGELWMETEDALIAKNMHKMISSAITINSKARDEPLAAMRMRSSSASEASKPILTRRPTISGNKTINSSPLSAYSSSLSTTTIRASTLITNTSSNPHYPFTAPYKTYGSQRRHSVSAMSTTISHQRAYSLPIEETYNINNDTINHKNGNGLLLSCKGHCNILNSNSNCTLQLQMQSTSNTCNICCCCNNNNSSGRCNSNKTTAPRQLQPVHQRTRSLPLTEETAISCINSNSPTNNHILNNNSVAGNHCNIILHQQQPQLQQQCCHHNSNHINMNNNNNNNNHSSNGAKLKSQSSSVIHYNNNNNYNSNSNKINCNCSCMFVGGNVVTTTNKGSLNNNCHLGGAFMASMATRERCDSLPSTRNRTASECSNHSITNPSMPPPRTIPSINQSIHRPHSMYNRHSHSPPMNTLSPSTGCSESEGSNLSIDEPDNICQSSTPDESGNFTARFYNNSRNTAGSSNVIPEENDDYTSCYTDTYHYSRDKLNNQGNMQSSLNLPIHDDIDNQDHYMALSPCASSPHSESCSHAASSLGNDFHTTKYNGGNHSRSSSLNEEGYMPMFGDTGKSSKKSDGQNTSNTSTYSINSRDPRYNDFHADHIDQGFDEMHGSVMERPTRTYSVGSRPEYNKRRLPVENIICNQQMDQSRVRAFSVGSRAKYPRCEQDLLREVTRTNILSSYNNNTIVGEVKGRKSTSAPMLVHKSQTSVERMSDLMEIDFSQNSSDRSGSGSVTESIASPVTATAATVPTFNNHSVPSTTVNLSSSPNMRSLHNRAVSNPVAVPFARPRCGTFGSSSGSPRTAGGYDDIDGINVPGDGYCEMKPGSFNKTPEVGSSGSSSGILSKLSNSPLKNSSLMSSSKPLGNEKINTSDYLTMSPSNSNSLSSSTSSLLRSTSRNDRSSSTNRLATSAENKQIAMETDSFPSTASGTPEGYMEMSWNKNKVNGGNATWSTQNRSPSMPIDINPKPKSLTQLNTQTSPCVDRGFLMEEEESHDQVDSRVVNSLTRQLSNSKHQPFNFIPSSGTSFSPKEDYNHHKCLVDATSGKIQLLNNSTDHSNPKESKILNTEGNQKLEALSNDYAEMTIGDNSSKFNDYADMSSLIAAKSKNHVNNVVNNDYVNLNPREERLVTSLTAMTPPKSNGIIKPAPQPATTTMLTPTPATTKNPSFSRQKSEPRRLPEQQDSEYEMMCPSPMFKPIKVEDDCDGYVPLDYGNNRKLQVNRTNSTSRPKSVEEFSSSSSAISAASSTSTLCGSNSNSSSSASILTATAANKSLSPTVNGGVLKVQHQQQQQQLQPTQPDLYYAKLDLPPCSTNNSSSNLASPAGVCVTPPVSGGSCSNSASASPSPISNVTQPPSFTYAKLDFNKTEEMQRK